MLRAAGKLFYFLAMGFAASVFTLLWYEIGEWRLQEEPVSLDQPTRAPVRRPVNLSNAEAQAAQPSMVVPDAGVLAAPSAPMLLERSATRPAPGVWRAPPVIGRHLPGPNSGL